MRGVMRSLVQVYALVVCFCALMCFVIALGLGIYDIIEAAAPEFTLTADRYSFSAAYQVSALNDGKEHTKEELAAAQSEQHRMAVAYQRQSALQSSIFAGIICAIDAAEFAVHWRIARRSEMRSAIPS
jgi:hypothetical protein